MAVAALRETFTVFPTDIKGRTFRLKFTTAFGGHAWSRVTGLVSGLRVNRDLAGKIPGSLTCLRLQT